MFSTEIVNYICEVWKCGTVMIVPAVPMHGYTALLQCALVLHLEGPNSHI